MAIRAISLAGLASTDTLTDPIFLGIDDAAAGGNYQTLNSISGAMPGTNYQVPTGKTLYLVALVIASGVAGGGIRAIGYGDTAVNNSVAAPTTPQIATINILALANTTLVAPIFVAVPAGKYPCIREGGTSAYGYCLGFVI